MPLFIIIPLGIVVVSLLGILFVVVRKMPYLKKLTPESHDLGETVWHDFFPEVITWYQHIPLSRYKETWLRETEKMLRRVRLLFSKIDTLSHALITRLHRHQIETSMDQEAANSEPGPLPTAIETPDVVIKNRRKKMSAEELKQQEQNLIVEIAKDPKDGILYEKLGGVYMELENYVDAVESFKAANKLDPENETFKQKLDSATNKLANVAK